MKKSIFWMILGVFSVVVLAVGVFHHVKELPRDLSFAGDMHELNNVEFLYDVTYKQADGSLQVEQSIFDAVWDVMDEAEDLLVIDMFLFNDYVDQDRDFPDLSGIMTDKLLAKRQEYPQMPIVLITDPINAGYYSYETEQIEELKANDIEVIYTDLDSLHDSNKVYTSIWRLLIKPFGEGNRGWLPNPFASEAPKMSLRSYFKLFNVKANHRKTIISEKNAIILSANAHNESGFASNIAFKVSGNIIRDMIETEQAVIDYSNGKTQIPLPEWQDDSGNLRAQYVTEGKALDALIKEINAARNDDTIWIGMFYIANRGIIAALKDASDRGVEIRLILDANQNAFGNHKVGLPNIPVANELHGEDNISIRWYDSDEDQYHTKLLYIDKGSESDSVVIGGSANHTTRNLDDLNLESNIKIIMPEDAELNLEIKNYFERLWTNEDGQFTVDYETHDNLLTPMLRFTYWLQKLTGLTTY